MRNDFPRAATQIEATEARGIWTTAETRPTETVGKGEVAQLDGDHQQVAHRLQLRAAQLGTPPSGHLDALGLDDLVHVLRSRERSSDVHPVVVAAQQEVAAEVEVLLVRVACVLARKARPQSAPHLLAFGDGIDLADLET